MTTIEQRIKQLAGSLGCNKVGIAAREALSDAPPSGDPGYLLPSARSVVAFAVALDPEIMRSYLDKTDWIGHCAERKAVVQKLYTAGDAIRSLLESLGHEAVNVDINNNYRPEAGARDITEMTEFHPEFSHRYAAIAAGIGRLGWSGNLMTPEHGALVELGSVITSAELEPDSVLDETPCDRCKMCAAVCPVGMIDPKISTEVRVAGVTEVISKKRPNTCCWIGCTGYEGGEPNGTWSNWSPYRLAEPIPEDDDALAELCIGLQKADPQMQLETNSFSDYRSSVFDPEWFYPSVCGFCRGVCWPDRKDRVENRKTVVRSGCAALSLDGDHVVAPSETVETETPYGIQVVVPKEQYDRRLDFRKGDEDAGRYPMDRAVISRLTDPSS